MNPKLWTDATYLVAEGARVAFSTCRRCGAAILLDPRDTDIDPVAEHEQFHIRCEGTVATPNGRKK